MKVIGRSEFCKKEVMEQESEDMLVGDIAHGVVFSGRPSGYSRGVFLKLGSCVSGNINGAVRLAYFGSGEGVGFVFTDDHMIRDYKELNVTLVDEGA